MADRFRTIGHSTILVLGIALTCEAAVAAPIVIPSKTITAINIPGAPTAPIVYIWDHFDRVNGAIGTAVKGGAWTIGGGSWTIATNLARSTAVTYANTTIAVPGVVNGQIEVDLTVGTTAQAGLDFLDDGTNNAMVLYRKSGATTQVRLYTWLGFGALPPPVATANVASASGVIPIKVIINGNVINVSWNNIPVISYTLTAPEIAALKDAGSNEFGMWAESDSVSRFNNFRFQSL